MLTRRQQVEEALNNIRTGTSRAARLKETAQNPEVRELATAMHFIGYGAQQAILAFTDRGRVNDID